MDRDKRIKLADAPFAVDVSAATGRSVLLTTKGQFESSLALIALDGLARKIVICPPDLSEDRKRIIATRTGTDCEVSQATTAATDRSLKTPSSTDWILLTSGTSGVPKTVRHTLATLTAAIKPSAVPASGIVWSTFYDIRRYGGLQILLRAILGGHSLVLSSADEPMAAFLVRAGANGVTHLTGTPSHWRSALMSQAITAISPRYIRLSGEIADQAVLDALKAAFPKAKIVHAYASTEAGVGFEVDDGREGFPASLVQPAQMGFELRVTGGALHIRSDGAARAYVGDGEAPLLDADGFADTGDMVERRGERYFFAGRRGGIINVGGAKVHPEEVEAVINPVPGVRVSQVRAKANPIVGAIVVADVVAADVSPTADRTALRDSIVAACRTQLAEYKVPVIIRFVTDLPLSPTGKLIRNGS